MAKLDKLFKAAVDYNASDIHVVTGEPFIIRQLGQLKRLKSPVQTLESCRELIFELLNDEQKTVLTNKLQLDFAYEIQELGRFRGSVMMHHKGITGVFRHIPPGIPTLQKLGLPDVVRRTLDNHQGLILVTGATGHGKSTTLAAMVDYINANRAHHIVTVEDPIEFVHPIKKGVVNQRQMGRDTLAYANALRGALREDPDVIMIGELRDLETVSLAISAAETGHLVIGTLSTASAAKTIDRIIDSYPPKEQNQIRAMLSETLKAVITQRLIPSANGKEMVLALEILIGTLPMANLIRDAKTFQIPSMMQTGKKAGMLLADDALTELVAVGKITSEQAALNAVNPARFKAKPRG